MLHDLMQKHLASSIDEYYKLLEDVLDERGVFVTLVDEHLPIGFRILKNVLGDLSYIKTLMIARNTVEIFRVGSIPELVPFKQVTMTDWLR